LGNWLVRFYKVERYLLAVIPANAGIQWFQCITDNRLHLELDSGFRRSDGNLLKMTEIT
jgi:hypothetical protein